MGAAHCSARILDDDDAIGALGDLRQEGVRQGGLAGGRAAGDEDIGARGYGLAKNGRLVGGHDVRRDVIGKAEDGGGWLADGESGRRDDGRQQSFEAFAAFRELRRDPRASRMHFGADMVGDEPHDTFAIGGRKALPGVGEPL